MRWLIIMFALLGFTAATLALREHYRTDTSPCSINEKWDCGTVNKSQYAVIQGIPVACIGMAGYLLLCGLAFWKSWRLLVAASLAAQAFSLYLSNIEAHVLEVWCIYCVISLVSNSAVSLLSIIALIRNMMNGRSQEHASYGGS